MELHTLGEGNLYGETAIHEAARALTGWRVTELGTAQFAPWRHDRTQKTVLGVSGALDDERLVRLLDVTASDNDSRWRAANVGAMAPAAFDGGESFVPSLRSVPSYVLQGDPRLRDFAGAQRRITDRAQLYAQQARPAARWR